MINGLNDFAKKFAEKMQTLANKDGTAELAKQVALCGINLGCAYSDYVNEEDGDLAYYLNGEGEAQRDIRNHGDRGLFGTAVEMVTCVLRVLDWCGANDIDIEYLLEYLSDYYDKHKRQYSGKIF